MDDDQVTQWFQRLTPSGDADAAQRLWERYFHRLVHVARKKLGPGKAPMSDEEDVALSAFDSFCRCATEGRFPQLRDREDLWKLLVQITAYKAHDHRKHERRKKRGGGLVRGESAFRTGDESEALAGIGQVMSEEPTPAFAAMVAEQHERLLRRLEEEDESLRRVAELRLQNYGVAEIADTLDCSVRTVKRQLARIRANWQGELDT